MQLEIPDSLIGRMIVSLLIGVSLPVVLIGILLIRSDGNEPNGMCERVLGQGGTLPIDMSRGGDVYYSCGLNWDYVAFNIGLPALGFAILAYLVLRLWQRSR
ncbi:MAG TPA: hypothetical protein VF194_19310 [Ferrovibrio sp.]|uniref:hypothetical protein n=1 Tax=Ferrovibrio sp. TaxID=1917215 RepID=UPI002ED3C6C4